MSKLQKSEANLPLIDLFADAEPGGVGLVQAGFIPKMAVQHNCWCCNKQRENHYILSGIEFDVVECHNPPNSASTASVYSFLIGPGKSKNRP